MKKKFMVAVTAMLMALACAFAFTGCAKKENVKIISVENVAIQLTAEEYAYGVNKSKTELKASIDTILNRIISDGTLEDIINKYFDDSRESERVAVEAGDPNAQLKVATNAEFPPFEYKSGNKFTGIDIEVAKYIADELNMTLYVHDMDFDAVITSVKEGKEDVAMAGLTISESRKESVDFTVPYYTSAQVLIVRESNTDFDDCKTAEDVENVLKGYKKNKKKAGFQNGTTGNFYVAGNADFEYEGFSNIKAKGFKSGALAVQALYNGSIDMVVIDEMPARSIVKSVNK